MTPKEAEKEYGKEMLKKMHKTGMLTGITCYQRAYKVATGKQISDFD